MDMQNKQETISADISEGLTSIEVAERVTKYGKNVIAEAQPSSLQLFLHKFWGIVPWMLEVAIVIDLILGKWSEAIVIVILLFFQAILGFYKEQGAKRAVALLKQKLLVLARVKRDGKWQILPALDLVPDDLVNLQAGDIVPTDVKLLNGEIFADQSQLTGESLPLEVNTGSVSYAGSIVTQGEATAVVLSIGDKTFYGKAASLVRLTEKPPLMQILAIKIAKYLLVIDIFLALGVFMAMLILGMPLLSILPFILMILVLSVPIALPAMSTVSATMGTQALAKNGVLATRLSAIENAATMDILCIDKTGTITENNLAIKQIVPISNHTEKDILRWAAFTAEESSKNAIDQVLLRAIKKEGLFDDLKRFFLRRQPFDIKNKYAKAWISENKQEILVVMGEPLSVVSLTQTPWSKIKNEVNRLAQDGSRILVVAIGTDKNLQLAGFICLADPVRKDSATLIQALKNQGIKVILLTGDNEATAHAVATKVGITGEMAPDNINYENIDSKSIERFNIFPRVFPRDKFFIVQALQKAGHVVGMTGDGVNDAPALRLADTGVAMVNATDIAKSAAGLVLTQPGFSGILEAIKISRNIYQRMKTWILAMVTRKTAIPFFIFLGIFIFKEPVITAFLSFIFMILGDIVTFSLSKDNVAPSKTPDRWIVRPLIIKGLSFASIMLLMSLGVFWAARYWQRLPLDQTQTVVFVWLVLVAGQSALYLVRTKRFFWEKPFPGRFFGLATVFDVIVMSILATQRWIMSPISIAWIGMLIIGAFCYLLIGNGLLLILKKFKILTN